MRRLRLILLTIISSMLLISSASAITTGIWDFSHIPGAIQRIAKDTDYIQKEEDVQLPDEFLKQLYAAKKAQRDNFYKWWLNR